MRRFSRPPRIVVVGDVLLDRDFDGRVARLAPDAPVPVVDELSETARPGGAGLAAALCEGTLVCAIGRDAAGERLRSVLPGDRVIDLGSETTGEKVRVRGGGHPYVRLDWGGSASEPGPLTGEARAAIMEAHCVLVADYGRGMTRAADVREALSRTPAPIVWDPHPRGGEPVPGALLVTPNAGEAGAAGGASLADAEDRGRELAERWGAVNVCVTLGARGALLVGGPAAPLVVPAPAIADGDPCGAGDCFAATAARSIAEGALPSDAVHAAVLAASAFVARGGASAFGTEAPLAAGPGHGRVRDAAALAAQVRAEGGTVVATGGCFDLLHAGHVRTLEAARALGDCLIVLINSDDSVRRLKGPERPLNGEDDRAAVLQALGAVDAVHVFSEDEPSTALEQIRPDLWVKGGDYRVADLPEARVLAEWGGRAVIVPFVDGKSTTRIIEEAVARVR